MSQVEGASPASSPRSPKKVTGCSERLAGLKPKSPPELPSLVSPRHISKDELDRHIYSVYTAAVEKKKKTRAASEQAQQQRDEALLLAGGTSQFRTSMEVQEIISRLSEESLRRRELLEVQLMQKYDETWKSKNRTRINSPSGRDSLSRSEMKGCVDRLYRNGVKKEKEHMDALVNKYCPERKSPRRTAEQMKAAAERMMKGEK